MDDRLNHLHKVVANPATEVRDRPSMMSIDRIKIRLGFDDEYNVLSASTY